MALALLIALFLSITVSATNNVFIFTVNGSVTANINDFVFVIDEFCLH